MSYLKGMLISTVAVLWAGPSGTAQEKDTHPQGTTPWVAPLEKARQAVRELPLGGGGGDGRIALVRAVWGNLIGLPGPAPMAWPGLLASSHGFTNLLAVPGFELGDRVLPQVADNTIQWRSGTRWSKDGVIGVSFFPTLPPPLRRPDLVTFFTPAFSATWPVGVADQVNGIGPADATGNLVSVIAVEPDLMAPLGFGEGQWHQGDPTRPDGAFVGRWTDVVDLPLGLVQGTWSPTGGGAGTMQGVVALLDGTPIAILVGTYSVTDGPPNMGTMTGQWLDPVSYLPFVSFEGNFAESPLVTGGFFQMKWEAP